MDASQPFVPLGDRFGQHSALIRADAGAVPDLEVLSPSTQFLKPPLREPVQRLHRPGPLLKQVRGAASELLIPHGERGVGPVALPDLAEQGVPLEQHLVEPLQLPEIAPAELCVHHVEVPAPTRRWPGHEVNVHGGESNDVDLADEVQRPSREAVETEALRHRGGRAGLTRLPCAQEDIGVERSVLVLDGRADPCERLMGPGGSAHRVPMDQLALRRRAHRLSSRQQLDRFQEIGLPLPIVSLDDGEAVREFERQSAEVAKIR